MSEVRAGFLGTLKSELDDSDEEFALDSAFEQLSILSGAARAAYLEYRLRPDKAAALFKMLRLRATDGFEWTVGPTSGMWYRRTVGTKEWARAGLPIGLAPVYDVEPDWLREGIGAYLVQNGSNPEELREEQRASDAATGTPSFESGLLNPFAELKENTRTTGSKAMEFGKENEDTDWLLEEWSEFDESLQKLREIRSQGVTEASRPELPANLPADWDADRALAEAAADDGAAPVTRVEPDAGDEAWEPRDRDGYVNPESFFLPPDEK